jgi:hypothetical protein
VHAAPAPADAPNETAAAEDELRTLLRAAIDSECEDAWGYCESLQLEEVNNGDTVTYTVAGRAMSLFSDSSAAVAALEGALAAYLKDGPINSSGVGLGPLPPLGPSPPPPPPILLSKSSIAEALAGREKL